LKEDKEKSLQNNLRDEQFLDSFLHAVARERRGREGSKRIECKRITRVSK